MSKGWEYFFTVASISVHGQNVPPNSWVWSGLKGLTDEACLPGSLYKFHSLVVGGKSTSYPLPEKRKEECCRLSFLDRSLF